MIGGKACICESATIKGLVEIKNSAIVSGNACINGDDSSRDLACIYILDNAYITGSANIRGFSIIGGNARIVGNAYINGAYINNTLISGDSIFNSNTFINKSTDIINISSFIFVHDSLSVFRGRADTIQVRYSGKDQGTRFEGNLDEFVKYIEGLKFDSNIIEQFRSAINNIKKTIEKDHDVFELTI